MLLHETCVLHFLRESLRRDSVGISLGSSHVIISTERSTREGASDSASNSHSATRAELGHGELGEQLQPQQPPQQPRASFSIASTSGENQSASAVSSSSPLLSGHHGSISQSSTSGGLLLEPCTSSLLAESQSVAGASGSASIKDETESLDTESSENSEGSAPREVGHNLYILAHKLAKFNKELSILLKSKESEALSYYAAHTAQIEVGPKFFFKIENTFNVFNFLNYYLSRLYVKTEPWNRLYFRCRLFVNI